MSTGWLGVEEMIEEEQFLEAAIYAFDCLSPAERRAVIDVLTDLRGDALAMMLDDPDEVPQHEPVACAVPTEPEPEPEPTTYRVNGPYNDKTFSVHTMACGTGRNSLYAKDGRTRSATASDIRHNLGKGVRIRLCGTCLRDGLPEETL